MDILNNKQALLTWWQFEKYKRFQALGYLTCPALGKSGLVTGGCGVGAAAAGAGGRFRMPGAVTGCACVIGGMPGRGPTGGGIPTNHKQGATDQAPGSKDIPLDNPVPSVP